MLNLKSQFGPDFIIAMVVVLLIGLGGVVFLQIFVGGLSMQGLLNVLDTEYDQKCKSILLTMVGDEYISTGENVQGRPYFNSLASSYSSIDAEGAIKSVRFEKKMDEFNAAIINANFPSGKITHMYYFLTSRSNAGALRDDIRDIIENDNNQNMEEYTICSISVLGIYEIGTAELYIRELRG